MNILITGAATGIGRATVKRFVQASDSFNVYGLDLIGWVGDEQLPRYTHITVNPSDSNSFPDLPDINILVNCFELHDSEDDLRYNASSVIAVTKKYGLQPAIRSILNLSSVAVHNGLELPEFVASKGSVFAFTKWTAVEVAKWGATCNSISVGGVIYDENLRFIEDKEKFQAIMAQTPLKKWATCEEIADWIYMFTVVNTSCSGQDLVIDNLESMNGKYIG